MKEQGSDSSASGGARLETTARYSRYRRFAAASDSGAKATTTAQQE
jgi:hypothetical protein